MIEVLKQALEALENSEYGDYDKEELNKAINAIKEALAQPEQEVNWEKLYRLEVKKKEALAAKYERDIKPLTRIVPMAQPEQEHFALKHRIAELEGAVIGLQAQRTWVELTDWEINSVAINNNPLDGIRTFARAIEAKLKERNS